MITVWTGMMGGVFLHFERAFREHGLPLAIRTDNGNPFATNDLCTRSELSVWWIELGIDHQRAAG